MVRKQFLRLIAAAAIGLFAAGQARAATEMPFSPEAFAAAQAAGKPILVDIWASWCPTCARQAPILKSLYADPANKDLVVFKVDFDAQKGAVAGFHARMQSTLIAFHGTTETARSVGDTVPASVAALVASCGN